MVDKMSDVTVNLIKRLREDGEDESFLIVPVNGLDRVLVELYWGMLKQFDTLKYRWSDMIDPTVEEVTDYCYNTSHCYHVIDLESQIVVADFTLGPFVGKAAQVHFSMNPMNPTPLSIWLASKVTDTILNQWKDVTNLEESFIDTMFGLTPVDNRVATVFIRKAGFKAIGTLISGANYLGETTDALLTMKSRTN